MHDKKESVFLLTARPENVMARADFITYKCGR